MNNNISNYEELLYNLPDYIEGKITDTDLIQKIEAEINLNPAFKSEFDLISSAIESVKGLKFSEPPDHYFSNLVPAINSRIENNKSDSTLFHFFRLSYLFKYALPALSVILVIIIINFSNKSNKDENMFVQSEKTINGIMNNNSDIKTDSTNNLKENNEMESNNENVESNVINKEKEINNSEIIKRKNKQETVSENNNINLLELFTENEESEDDYYYESDFNTLSQSEQNEILNKLTKTNF